MLSRKEQLILAILKHSNGPRYLPAIVNDSRGRLGMSGAHVLLGRLIEQGYAKSILDTRESSPGVFLRKFTITMEGKLMLEAVRRVRRASLIKKDPIAFSRWVGSLIGTKK